MSSGRDPQPTSPGQRDAEVIDRLFKRDLMHGSLDSAAAMLVYVILGVSGFDDRSIYAGSALAVLVDLLVFIGGVALLHRVLGYVAVGLISLGEHARERRATRRAGVDWVAVGVVGGMVHVLPATHRSRYRQEYLAELQDVKARAGTRRAQVAFALRASATMGALRRALSTTPPGGKKPGR